ncbi:hypothetical protein OG968_35835 (plasmid) [Streptomyces althioticus]|uniref:hypothetical protein n=1 Tax=Streptomyces althioticus TaxID=83380 RepID=UPI002F90E6CB|nr:hypothetical protein OG968_35835 [Streptomyces althioticus]
MSEATTYRGREQMDAVKAKAAQAQAAAESRRTNALTSIEIEEAREKAAERKELRKQAAKTKKLEERARRREKAAAARKARNERLSAAIGQPLPWVMTVVITSIAFAFPGQFSAVVGLGVIWVLALLVPVFIEGATWAMAWLRKWAVANNKPAKLYTVMTWLFASVAAALNAWHHLDKPQLAVVFAASSLFGVAVWEIYMHSQSHAAGGRDAADIKLALQRRIRHPRVSRRASWLRTATIPALSESEAWAIAWRQIRGTEPGLTKRTLKRHNRLAEKIAEAAEKACEPRLTASLDLFAAPVEPVREVGPGEAWAIDPQAIARILADPANASRADRAKASGRGINSASGNADQKATQGAQEARTRAAKPQVTPNNPPLVRGREKAADGAGGKQARAARTLAAETARAATPEQAEAEKRAAREWVLEQLRAGREVGWRDVQRYFEKEIPEQQMRMVRGETWCRQRIKEAEREHGGDPALTLVG